MDVFLKSAAAILLALVIYMVLSKYGKDFSVLLTVTVCCIVATSAIHYLRPVIQLFYRLQNTGELDTTTFSIIIRAVGIGLLAEIVSTVCTDAGNAAMGKTLQVLASAVILWMSVPLFDSLISLVEEILVSV